MYNNEFITQIKGNCYVSEYDTIIIGFLVWWYTAPTMVNIKLLLLDF